MKDNKGVIYIALTVLCLIVLQVNVFSQDFANALEFDGTDDFVFVGNDSSLFVDQFTLTSWVNPYSYSGPIPEETRMEIFEKTGEYWMNISTNGGYLRDKGEVRVGGIFDGQWHFLDSEFIVPLNQWTHVACTYDFDSLKLFINGQYEIAMAIPENHTDHNDSANMLALGCKNVSGLFGPIEAQFHGMLDEISIWDIALNVSDIRNLMSDGINNIHPYWDRLLAYYKFNEDKIGQNVGVIYDEKAMNNGYNYGAFWVSPYIADDVKSCVVVKYSALQQNFPNPFNRITNIPFSISKSNMVQLNIYDISGRLVEVLVNNWLEKGDHIVQWDASGFPSGSYFYELRDDDSSQVRKCVFSY